MRWMEALVAHVLDGIAIAVAHQLSEAEAAGLPLQEETVTETLLLKLHRRLGPAVKLKAFSRRQESRVTGADWELLITGRALNLPSLRVQAKRSHRKRVSFSHRSPDGVFQVDRLIIDAVKTRSIPVYAIYHQQNARDRTVSCSLDATRLPSEVMGVSILAAGHGVTWSKQTSVEISQVINRAISLGCLARCSNVLDSYRGCGPENERIAWHLLFETHDAKVPGDSRDNRSDLREALTGIFDIMHLRNDPSSHWFPLVAGHAGRGQIPLPSASEIAELPSWTFFSYLNEMRPPPRLVDSILAERGLSKAVQIVID